jgi:hypothetical protein
VFTRSLSRDILAEVCRLSSSRQAQSDAHKEGASERDSAMETGMNLWIRVTVQSGNFPEIPVFESDLVRPGWLGLRQGAGSQGGVPELIPV